jgi:hypothetical protein
VAPTSIVTDTAGAADLPGNFQGNIDMQPGSQNRSIRR